MHDLLLRPIALSTEPILDFSVGPHPSHHRWRDRSSRSSFGLLARFSDSVIEPGATGGAAGLSYQDGVANNAVINSTSSGYAWKRALDGRVSGGLSYVDRSPSSTFSIITSLR